MENNQTSKNIKNFYRELNNGYKIPSIGFGVYKLENFLECKNAVKKALEIGYRLIDTAEFYKNEEAVGQAIKESNIKREEIFVTTKVWVSNFGKKETLEAFKRSIKKLGLDYIDMYMIHWPYGKYLEAYQVIEELYLNKKIKVIGVSNCSVSHLKEILKIAKIKPSVNQLECNPYCQRQELAKIHQENKIILEAWSPLKRADANLYSNKVLTDLAKKYSKTISQIILKWHVQNGYIPIPKSSKDYRIVENFSIWDFSLTDKEMESIKQLDQNLIYQNPESEENEKLILSKTF